MDQYGDLIKPKHAKTTLLILGADGPLGRDELIRLLDGGRTSLEIGLLGALIAAAIGAALGSVAGYFGGWVDVLVARLTETLMAFPLLLFLIFASVRLRKELMAVAYGSVLPQGVVGLAVLIGVFTSFYPTRLVRSQLLTLRNAEFVEAEHMVGASDWRILVKHLLPHLVPTLLIWGAIAIATNILLEVGLSFIGVGVQPETPTWGSMLSTTWGTIYNPTTYNAQAVTVWLTVFPTAAILITVAVLNQLSEGARRALEPWATR
jgi:ABC-type dipeptide/oligopeptide/nickel transport system permease subunit